MNILSYGADPWSIGDIGILDNNQLANGPGIRLCDVYSG